MPVRWCYRDCCLAEHSSQVSAIGFQHGKTTRRIVMAGISIHERVGRPQILAGLLLLVFLMQCLWLTAHTPLTSFSGNLFDSLNRGAMQWHGGPIAADSLHSPLWFLMLSAPVAVLDISPRSQFFPCAIA